MTPSSHKVATIAMRTQPPPWALAKTGDSCILLLTLWAEPLWVGQEIPLDSEATLLVVATAH